MSDISKENNEPSFEEAVDRLNKVVKELSGQDISLEESFSLYEEGVRLLKYCNDKLDMVEKKVLMINEQGIEQEL